MSKIEFEIVKEDVYDEEVSLNSLNQTIPYGELLLPKRGSSGSAGYDFYSPVDFTILPGESKVIPTFIKVCLGERDFLAIYPRSSLGFKYQMVLANTVGIIDSDYYGNESNDGHIKIRLCNMGDKTIEIKKGDRFVQGIIQEFKVADNDSETTLRTGGIGSTGK